MYEYKYKIEENRFYIPNPLGGEDIAELSFVRIGSDKVDINHTYVNPHFRGRGIAQKLLEFAVEKFREENRKIIPTCSFVAQAFAENPAYRDICAKG